MAITFFMTLRQDIYLTKVAILEDNETASAQYITFCLKRCSRVMNFLSKADTYVRCTIEKLFLKIDVSQMIFFHISLLSFGSDNL